LEKKTKDKSIVGGKQSKMMKKIAITLEDLISSENKFSKHKLFD
jgi:hypothetical protein